MSDFYIVSVKHTKREDKYITLWRPDDKGYCYRTEFAGKYSAERITAHLSYYHTGYDVAVPCEVLDAIAMQSEPGYLDVPGLVVANKKGTWFDILYAPLWPLPREPQPQYKGARRPKASAAQLTRCAAGRDGECGHAQCPQLRDGEPAKSHRHCPLDVRKDDE
jgi:hypothetical protein